ncbi:unnamed protein product, partial [Prorocentrum cordatum]
APAAKAPAPAAKSVGISEQDLKMIRKDMDRAKQRVEELEVQSDASKGRISALESERQDAEARAERFREDAEANLARADRAEKELEAARERLKELEAKIGPLEARAEGLSSLLTGIGRSVGAALKDSEVADGDLSLFDTALADKANLEAKTYELEQMVDESQVVIGDMSQKLTSAEKQAQLLEKAQTRANKLSQGLRKIMEKSGANTRGGFLGALFGRSEDEMIQDTLDQIDDMKGRKP